LIGGCTAILCNWKDLVVSQTSMIGPPTIIIDYFPYFDLVMFVIALFALTLVALMIAYRRNIRSGQYWIVTIAEIAVLGYGWVFFYIELWGDIRTFWSIDSTESNHLISSISYVLSLAVTLLILGFVETYRSRRWSTKQKRQGALCP